MIFTTKPFKITTKCPIFTTKHENIITKQSLIQIPIRKVTKRQRVGPYKNFSLQNIMMKSLLLLLAVAKTFFVGDTLILNPITTKLVHYLLIFYKSCAAPLHILQKGGCTYDILFSCHSWNAYVLRYTVRNLCLFPYACS